MGRAKETVLRVFRTVARAKCLILLVTAVALVGCSGFENTRYTSRQPAEVAWDDSGRPPHQRRQTKPRPTSSQSVFAKQSNPTREDTLPHAVGSATTDASARAETTQKEPEEFTPEWRARENDRQRVADDKLKKVMVICRNCLPPQHLEDNTSSMNR
jgi:hypothetical protein